MITATAIWLGILGLLIFGIILTFVLGLILRHFNKPLDAEYCHHLSEVLGTVFDVVFLGGLIIGTIIYFI
jgi:hypothetical protein